DSGDNVHVVWSGAVWDPAIGAMNLGISNIQHRVRTGAGWQLMEMVTDLLNPQQKPAIAIDGADNLHVLWQGTGPSSINSINYRKRTSAGWQTIEPVSNGTDPSQDASVAVDLNGDVHAVWVSGSAGGSDLNVFYRSRSSTAWRQEEQVTNLTTTQN